jgi:hypothetical protein
MAVEGAVAVAGDAAVGEAARATRVALGCVAAGGAAQALRKAMQPMVSTSFTL